jgi:hypothetical protein
VTRVIHERLGHVRWSRATPLLAFLLVYTVTCLVGAILMLEQYRPFVALYEYFSGSRVPRLSHEQGTIAWSLLLAAPALLCIGYLVGLAIPVRFLGGARTARVVERMRLETPDLLPHVVFYVLAFAAVLSLRHAGSFDNLSSWFHYASWIESRQHAFERIGFLGFVNIYLLVPAAAAWVVVTARGRSRRSYVLRWLPFVIALGLALLLFQKKAAVVTALIVFSSWIYRTVVENRRRAIVTGLAALTAIVCLYFAAIVLPVYSRSQEVVSGHTRQTPVQQAKLPPREARLISDRRVGILVYSVLAPVVRTSAPALYYPVVYPDEHGFYGLDVGQDVLGVGAMPNDNVVIWNQMNPDFPGGNIAAPFQFPLYSQVGLSGALPLSAVLGFLLALLWRGATAAAWPRPWASLFAAIVVVLGMYFAIDSPRNSTLVSYGVLWAFLFIAAAAVCVHLINRLALARRRDATTRRVRQGEVV